MNSADDLEILTLGPYDPDANSGPAIWIRTAVSGLSGDGERSQPPVVYMPGVSREQFRRLEECPAELKPLAELQFRGAFWTQANGRDWTPMAFVQNLDHGLGVQIRTDQATQKALGDTLNLLLTRQVGWLANRAPIDASTLYELVEGDPMRTLLLWIGEPESLNQLSTGRGRCIQNEMQGDIRFRRRHRRPHCCGTEARVRGRRMEARVAPIPRSAQRISRHCGTPKAGRINGSD